MQRLSLKASTTATDQELGTFTAIVSAWDADREGDVIEPTAFDKTIKAWQDSGKQIPLLFEHGSKSVGAIDPHSMHPTDAGLAADGEVDRDTDEGRQVWKMVKAGSIGFSIGFMSKSEPREGGGRRLVEIDLLEISATSTPMHPATRTLSWKTAGPDADDREWQGMRAAWAKADLAHEAANRKREQQEAQEKWIEELAAKAEAKAAREAKRNRPIKIAKFDV
jgi:HK97 family phage prohead protease